ncbi:MAG: Inositol 2-dehydrogenase/D-chiro-inositol 3-dehydrogenase [Gemmatimonadaceae bacterium]|nr:Inositol 2-dehydrogenase/D-chiro-inositol 3-dehydrogenase [Gemmatimonadaceae bacterium]
MKPNLQVAVVGVGAISQLVHIPVLSRTKGVQIVALVDADRPKARAIAERFGVPYTFTEIDDALGVEGLDAIVIATPNHLHEPHVLASLAAGVDVLCERPLSLSAKGVERILAAATRGGRKVLVGNNHRFRSDVQGLDRFMRGGELGRLAGIRAGAYRPRGRAEGWRTRRQESGGGALLEHGLPLIDLALWLADFPPPTRIWAHMDRRRGANTVEDSAVVALECNDGAAFVFDVSLDYTGVEERWWFEALCARGSARLAPLRVVKEINSTPIDVSPSGAAARESAFLQSYRAELAHFTSVVRAEIEYEAPTDQVVLLRVLEAAYRSADEGREVRL